MLRVILRHTRNAFLFACILLLLCSLERLGRYDYAQIQQQQEGAGAAVPEKEVLQVDHFVFWDGISAWERSLEARRNPVTLRIIKLLNLNYATPWMLMPGMHPNNRQQPQDSQSSSASKDAAASVDAVKEPEPVPLKPAVEVPAPLLLSATEKTTTTIQNKEDAVIAPTIKEPEEAVEAVPKSKEGSINLPLIVKEKEGLEPSVKEKDIEGISPKVGQQEQDKEQGISNTNSPLMDKGKNDPAVSSFSPLLISMEDAVTLPVVKEQEQKETVPVQQQQEQDEEKRSTSGIPSNTIIRERIDLAQSFPLLETATTTPTTAEEEPIHHVATPRPVEESKIAFRRQIRHSKQKHQHARRRSGGDDRSSRKGAAPTNHAHTEPPEYQPQPAPKIGFVLHLPNKCDREAITRWQKAWREQALDQPFLFHILLGSFVSKSCIKSLQSKLLSPKPNPNSMMVYQVSQNKDLALALQTCQSPQQHILQALQLDEVLYYDTSKAKGRLRSSAMMRRFQKSDHRDHDTVTSSSSAFVCAGGQQQPPFCDDTVVECPWFQYSPPLLDVPVAATRERGHETRVEAALL